MVARAQRPRNGSPARIARSSAAAAQPSPVMPGGDEDEDAEEDSEEDEDEEETAAKSDELESDTEIARAAGVESAVFGARQAARDKEIVRQQATGSQYIDYLEVKKVEEAAETRVRTKLTMKRGPGIYVTSPLTCTNESGQRIELPVDARMPDVLVERFSKNRVTVGRTRMSELEKLINDGVLNDMR